jgi:hypothetical protein
LTWWLGNPIRAGRHWRRLATPAALSSSIGAWQRWRRIPRNGFLSAGAASAPKLAQAASARFDNDGLVTCLMPARKRDATRITRIAHFVLFASHPFFSPYQIAIQIN